MSPDCVQVRGGRAMVGTNEPHTPPDAKGPIRHVKVKPFYIEPTTVINAMFQKFAPETGYVTEAE